MSGIVVRATDEEHAVEHRQDFPQEVRIIQRREAEGPTAGGRNGIRIVQVDPEDVRPFLLQDGHVEADEGVVLHGVFPVCGC